MPSTGDIAAAASTPDFVTGTEGRFVLPILRVLVVVVAGALSWALFVSGPDAARSVVTGAFGFGAVPMPRWGEWVLYVLYLAFVFGSVFPFLLFLGWAPLAAVRRTGAGRPPFVSVVIPAFNEERSIATSLRAALAQDYPAYEVIVVDDGSTDMTLPFIENAAVKCVRMRNNKGKAQALNAGIVRAAGDIVVVSDSDSWLHPAALRHLVPHFDDERVGAVAGMIYVNQPDGMLRRWQALEYLFGQALVKTAQMGSGASVTICPGPVSAFRRRAIERAGGFKSRTITEDFDVTLDLVGLGNRVVFEPQAIAYTDAPASWGELARQRLRAFCAPVDGSVSASVPCC